MLWILLGIYVLGMWATVIFVYIDSSYGDFYGEEIVIAIFWPLVVLVSAVVIFITFPIFIYERIRKNHG